MTATWARLVELWLPISGLRLMTLAASALVLHGSAAEHQMDGLGLGVAQQFVNALFAPEPAVLVAAERRSVEMARGAVDPHIAGLDRARGPEGGVEIVGEDRCGQAVFGGVGQRQGFLLVAPAE